MRTLRWMVTIGLAAVCTVGTAAAQVAPDTSAAAQELAKVLAASNEGPGPRFIAANDPADENRFVAAMLIPNVQLMIVSASYPVPVLLRERLLTGKYQDAYMDLSTATDRKTRVTIEDIQADGLAFKPSRDHRAGDLVVREGDSLRFDGNWRKKKMKEEEYTQEYEQARKDYVRLVGLLVEQAGKKP